MFSTAPHSIAESLNGSYAIRANPGAICQDPLHLDASTISAIKLNKFVTVAGVTKQQCVERSLRSSLACLSIPQKHHLGERKDADCKEGWYYLHGCAL